MLHICTGNKGLSNLKIKVKSYSSNAITEVCQCGKLVTRANSNRNLTKKLLYLILCIDFILLAYLLYAHFSKETHINPSVIDYNIYDNDLAVTLGQDDKTFFLQKTSFLKHTKEHQLQLRTIDEFRHHLIKFLQNKSTLVQDTYKEDSTALWQYIQKHDTKNIDTITTQLDQLKRRKKLNFVDLKGWNNLIVYTIGDSIEFSETLKEETYNDSLLLSIPKEYFATINNKKQKLKLSNLKRNTQNPMNIEFQYSVLGLRKHSNKKGILHFNDKSVVLESLGDAAYIETKNHVRIELLIEDIVFKATL